MAYITRLTKTSMLDALNQDYIRTARAKECTGSKVIFKHALKNAPDSGCNICWSYGCLYSDRFHGCGEHIYHWWSWNRIRNKALSTVTL